MQPIEALSYKFLVNASYPVEKKQMHGIFAPMNAIDQKQTPLSITHETDGSFLLKTSQWLPASREEVFSFFSDAVNLERITPSLLNFKILTPQPVLMQRGTLIDYRLKIRGIPVRWQTKITEWEPPFRFVDFQLKGPYRLWEHLHTFEEGDGGTWVHDQVRYRVPFGNWVNTLFVQPDIERIFQHRHRVLASLMRP